MDDPAVELYDRLGDGEAKPGARGVPCALSPVEPVEDAGDIRLGHGSRVLHADLCHARRRVPSARYSDGHAPPLSGVLQGVLHDIQAVDFPPLLAG